MSIRSRYPHLYLERSLFYCNAIIPKVSRSFALGITALKGQPKNSILAGYLLCRIADTIEDDPKFSFDKKISYLNLFIQCFSDKNQIPLICKLSAELTADNDHKDLVKNSQRVFCLFYSLSSNSQSILKRWIVEMARGMIQFVSQHKNKIRIRSVSEYKEYCYYVAGTVGLMLTELWKEYAFFLGEKKYQLLLKTSKAFGEGLQTINILKDICWDRDSENSIYIPLEILQKYGCNHENMCSRELISKGELAVKHLVSLSHEDLKSGMDYIQNIPKFNLRIRFFCILPLLLAFATLKKIKSVPSLLNPHETIKISRREVKTIYRMAIFSSLSNRYFMKCIAKG